MNCKTITVAVMIAISSPALADNTVTEPVGTWSTKGGCQDRELTKLEEYPDGFDQQLYLTANGVEGWEWGCQFLSKLPNSYGQTVIIASCSAEGESWPEMIMLEYYAPDEWMLTGKSTDGTNNTIAFTEQCEKN